MSFAQYTIPAPGGGLNLIDGNTVPFVPENDALELINLYPENLNKVCLRGGLQDYCDSGETVEITTLDSFRLQSGATKVIAATNNKLYEVATTTPDDITGSTTPTSDEWNTVVFNNRIFLMNGADTMQVYTGSGNAADAAFTGGSTPSLDTLIAGGVYKERLYFVEENSASFWYGGSQSISGALTEFPLDSFLTRGGYLLYAGGYTNQTADSSAALFMAASSEGEILFYSGSNPGDASWTLVARYYVGRPLGFRAFVEVDNDTWIITEQGIVPVSLLFQGGAAAAENAISRKINRRIQEHASFFGVSHRWRGVFWPQGKRVYILYPVTGANSRILVCNTETLAWCEYTYSTAGRVLDIAINAGIPYAGDDSGQIRKMEQNQNDDGEAITFKLTMPYNYFGNRQSFKRSFDVRPLIRTASGVELTLFIDTDYKRAASGGTIRTSTGTATPWGSPWGSPWSSGAKYLYDRYSLSGQGHSGAIRIQGSIDDAPFELNAIEIRYNAGGQV